MPKHDSVLVTGGAGFIGSHVVDLLLQNGHNVTIVDNLDPQVHGVERRIPLHLEKNSSIVIEDVRNKEQFAKILKNADAVIHLAAAVGVGQSMYQIESYVDSNTRGTAVLLDLLVNREHKVKKLVIASSMSVYGEGKYYCPECGSFQTPNLRSFDRTISTDWEHRCESCGKNLRPVPTDEDVPLKPTSIYAMSKRHQEEMSLLIGKTYGIRTVALRFFNTCGPGQSLSNPYTGTAAIFMSRILNKRPPYIFEDGNQLRDFVHVKDVSAACLLALERSNADYLPVNVGTGKPISIAQMAETLIDIFGADIKPYISRKFRKGDVRHCFASTERSEKLLKFRANRTFRETLTDLVQWTRKEASKSAVDMFDKSLSQLRERNLA